MIALLLLTACNPQDAVLSDAFFAVWFSENTSATVYEDRIDLETGVQRIDCILTGVEEEIDPAFCSEELQTWLNDTCFSYEYPVDGPGLEPPDYLSDWTYADYCRSYFTFFADDSFLLRQGSIEPWRSEAIMTNEGDFQLTVHMELEAGEDFRFAFVLDPDYEPSVCVQEGQTCYTLDGGALQDDDGDGVADHLDPDCIPGFTSPGRPPAGGWEVGFDPSLTCNNGFDDDNDGLVDLADPECAHVFANEVAAHPTCDDGVDNDGDSWFDLQDPDCATFGAEEDGRTSAFSECSDGVDNDGDGDVDQADGQCRSALDGLEDGPDDSDECGDEFDNDGDGWVDQGDPDCSYTEVETGYLGVACNNGVDDDVDGDVDRADGDCLTGGQLTEALRDVTCTDGSDNDKDSWTDDEDPDCIFGGAEDGAFAGLTVCNDGIDNDGDGDIDSDDRSCRDALSTGGESNPSGASCTDKADNDGDGWLDAEDPDCIDSLEYGLTFFPCNDGLDNDGDGSIDRADADCSGPTDVSEGTVDPSCADGSDNDGNSWTDAADPACFAGLAEGDALPSVECFDGNDNDGDGGTDADDVDCANAWDNRELPTSSCADGIDNDGDNYVDLLDGDCADSAIGFELGYEGTGCNNGQDDDGDGLVDGADSGCFGSDDPFEQEFDECSDGVDNDGDGWVDESDPDCRFETPVEDGSHTNASQCNDATDNDGDGAVDAEDEDCSWAWDNIEAADALGAPVPFFLDSQSAVDNWSADEGGTIYYLNAGAYQTDPNGRDPSDESYYWSLPNDWAAGFGTAKFSSDEFFTEPGDYYYSFLDLLQPSDADYAAFSSTLADAAATWSSDFADYGGITTFPVTVKTEDNAWRPWDFTTDGFDRWGEVYLSWVRVDPGSTLEVGGSASGEFQLFLTSYEGASKSVIRGKFDIAEIREDRWGYDDLEAVKFEENGNVPCAF